VPISRRGLIAAGLALTTVGAVGVASTLNAGAAQIAEPPSAVAAANLTAQHRKPPAALPGGGTARTAGKAKGIAAAAADDAAPLEPTPEFAPKGLPGRTAAKASNVNAASAAKAAPAPAVSFLYASASQNANSEGTYATMTIAKPELAEGDYHSLAEVAAQSANGKQIIEVGWTVDRNVNGDSDPHLFVYHWVDGVETCYNGCGFVQYSANVKPGSVLPTGVAKRFAIQHYGDVWWIMYDNEWVGYFPDSLWAGRFTRTGLTQWFGEVAAASAAPCTDMGNGKPALDPASAAITDIGYLNGPKPKITTGATSLFYTALTASANAYRFGGEGAC
jgi:hypothetical protein